MIGVGIDVAKMKSMVAILSDDGEIIKAPFEISNTESGLSLLCEIIKELSDKVYCVVESTSVYHFPVLSYLQENDIFVSVVNPLIIKKYASMDMNWYDLKVKTLKIQRRIFADKEKELTKAEYERLLTAAKNKKNERLYYLMQTIGSTGLRISELKYVTC